MQDMVQNKTQVETVNFRLYFKVTIRQNEIQLRLRYIQRREKAFDMCPEVRKIYTFTVSTCVLF